MNKMWDELLYGVDVIRVTNGPHIEHLQNGKKYFVSLFGDINIIFVGAVVYLQ
jgi:hypothetical protein